jgi:hypothetical protein
MVRRVPCRPDEGEEFPATVEEVFELLYGAGTVLLVRPPAGWAPEWVHDEHWVMQ